MEEVSGRSDGISLRSHGSTVGVSSVADDDQCVLMATVDYRTRGRMPFGYLCGPSIPLIQKLKCALDGSSGEPVTISCRDDDQRDVVLAKLDVLLDCEKGPYILSDLRIGDDSRFPRRRGLLARSAFTDVCGRVAPPSVFTSHLDARSTNDDLSDAVTIAPRFRTTAAVLVAAP
jgi:hypothetical protein